MTDGSSRRCSVCKKVVLLRGDVHQSSFKSSKTSLGQFSRSSSRRKSRKRVTPGDEHWSKVLQANEVNSNVCVFSCNGHSCQRREEQKIRQALFQSRNEKSNLFTNLYERFRQWLSPKKGSQGNDGETRRSRRSTRCSESGSVFSSTDFMSTSGSEYGSRYDGVYSDHCSISSMSDGASLYSYSSGPSSIKSPVFRRSNAVDDGYVTPTGSLHEPEEQISQAIAINQLNSPRPILRSPIRGCSLDEYLRSTTKHVPMLKFRTWPKPTQPEPSLCATWPPEGATFHFDDFYGGVDIFDEGEESNKCSHARRHGSTISDYVGDFAIPYSDITFGKEVRVGRQFTTYRGRWHGDVMIHVANINNDDDLAEFYAHVCKLGRVRHENVSLFMGACLEPPNYAVVTSIKRGTSLYEEIHIHSRKSSIRTKIQILRKICQAMGYLHAKGIVLRMLNTRNIFLEPKVKISAIDCGLPEKKYHRQNYGFLPRGGLTYIAPEMMSSLRIESSEIVFDEEYTQETDVYSFGTVVYELLTGQFPFPGLNPDVIIWRICSGEVQSLSHIKCGAPLKNIIRNCWMHTKKNRPSFPEIGRALQINVALQKRHSSSEPEKLNKIGIRPGFP